jgi:hypothetical protein
VDAVCELIQRVYSPPPERCLYQPRNLGIRWAPPAAISWFFDQVEEGVILEDDCIPGADFFPFVQWALERYRATDRVKMIAGFNRFASLPWTESYHFIQSAMIWGWASWRRAWKDYDPEFKRWRSPAETRRLHRWLGPFPVRDAWKHLVQNVERGALVTWDVAWCWTIFHQQGLCIYPRVSLIQNIGFGADATNTGSHSDERSRVIAQTLPPPYREPRALKPDRFTQARINRKEFWRTDDTWNDRLKRAVRSWIQGQFHAR